VVQQRRRRHDRWRGTLHSTHKGGDTAEVAVAVVDHMQRRGIGRLLLAHLADVARERGIGRFRAEVMGANHAVRALVHELDANVTPAAVDGNIVVYDLEVPADGAEAPLQQQPVSDA
jgi:GNAT superfamily N-acetyltransferase